jgi:hypothetical protein
MKNIALTVFVLLALAVGIFAGNKLKAPPPPPALITFEKLGELVSLKVNVADIVEFTNTRNLGIPWTNWKFGIAGTKVVLIVRGDCLLTTDLTVAKYDYINTTNRTATVTLPTPSVKQARLNHGDGGTRIYAISNKGLEKIIPGGDNRKEAIDEAMKLAQQKVDDASRNPEVIHDAKENAERVLKAMYNGVNWNVKIIWI